MGDASADEAQRVLKQVTAVRYPALSAVASSVCAQIVEQIGHVFDSDREPQQPVGDAAPLAIGLRNRSVRHARRMTDQRFDAAEALGQAEIASAGPRTRARARGPSSTNETMPPKPLIWRLRELVLRMRRQPGIVDACDVVARLEKLGDRLGVARVLAHAQRERLCAAHRQPRIVRARNAADGVLLELDRVVQRPASSVIATPPTTSLWPPMYFVVECTTICAPSASGCWKYGVANVLSTATS